MKKITILYLLGLVGAVAPLVTASAGVEDIVKKCAVCHGDDGTSKYEEVPNIAGMSTVYIHDTMVAYQEKERPGKKFKPEDGEETDMNAVAEKLSEDDINALADYYAAKPFVPHLQEVDAEMAAKGKKTFDKLCEKCHSESGTVADDDAGILLGQWKTYLQHEFELFDSQKRLMVKKMRKRYEKLSQQDKVEILEYLAGGKK